MNILPAQRESIRNHFFQMQDKQDLLALLNEAKVLLFGQKAQEIHFRQLNFYLLEDSKAKSYRRFEIKKKTGGKRVIYAPTQGLKVIQRCLAFIFGEVYPVSDFATGFVSGRSVVDNARFHLQQHYVFNLDLKDFFPGIDQARIWGRLQQAPFSFNKATGRLALSNVLAKLCCFELEVERVDELGNLVRVMRNVLPQGAPTSPVLSNLICERLDRRLAGVAKRFGARYSRYADDISFSSLHNLYQKDSKFILEVERVIQDQNFLINTKKTRLQGDGYRQEVTGLLVNEKINVRRSYIKSLRKWLYLWEQYGLDKASGLFKMQYLSDKGAIKVSAPEMERVLKGKLDYLAMVKGSHDGTYQKLMARFLALAPRQNAITAILDIWEREGIEQAMKKYYEQTA
ncbi:reverse transcriptase family protein [Pedobacter aquatilis]|uniref:reverse transcriptase family protein n=1 Tax=Pedobacter aquatilis TaxID=351343 RepID=UPI00292D9299|nr:reverse transcriptase family protein [Pedobacter aquatilis]